MHTITFWISFIILPSFSLAQFLSCEWNDPAVIERESVIVSTDTNHQVRIYNATLKLFFDTEPVNLPIPNYQSNLYWVNELRFKGNTVQGLKDVYVEDSLSKLRGFYTHFQKSRFKCRVTFMEIKEGNLEDKNIESAIVSLAQSCIQMKLCTYHRQMEIDRDANVYYQSVQSMLNELADVVGTMILKKTVTGEYHSVNLDFLIKPITISGVTIMNLRLHGLQSLHRIQDVIIKKKNNSLNFVLKYRFSFLFLLNNVRGLDSHVIISGPTFLINGRMDYTDQSCVGKITSIALIRVDSVVYSLPIYEVPQTMTPKDFINLSQPKIDSFIEGFSIDCLQYVKMITPKI